jgi:hypothetical protein
MAKEKKSLSQILTDIGESIVAYELQKKGWQAMRNIGGIGFDIFAKKGDIAKKIEVKSIDPGQKSGRYYRYLTQTVSDAERHECDFVVIYIHGDNKFFIIPKDRIPSSNYIRMYKRRDGSISSQYAKFENAWDLLE